MPQLKRILTVILFYLMLCASVVFPTFGSVSPNRMDSPQKIALGIYAGDGPGASSQIEAVEEQINHEFPIRHVYTGFNQRFVDFREQKLEPMHREGSVFLISWAPGVGHGTLYKEIANGKTDRYLTDWAKGIKAWEKPVMIRFAYEMNMKNMAWNGTDVNGGSEAFIAAWRRIHDIFETQGVTNVQWVWCPHADRRSPYYTDLMTYYPGDEYVDWIGLDGYNWSVRTGQEAESFDGIFRQAYVELARKNKPMMIAEIGTAFRKRLGSQWLTTAFEKIVFEYPKIKAVVYFNADFSKRGEKDWRFTRNPQSVKAYRYIAQTFAYTGPLQPFLALD